MTIFSFTADASRENSIRVVFSTLPDQPFSGLLDPNDAFDVGRYTLDGSGRAVAVVSVEQLMDIDPTGKTLDVWLDRAMSPYPAQYQLHLALTGASLPPDTNPVAFFGCARPLGSTDPAAAIPSRDIANPQTLASLLNESGNADPALLGVYNPDNTGDYGVDEGVDNLKKRVFRRLITSKGAFLHAADYGVGITGYVKRLNVPSVREALATEAETQIAREPDVKKVRVSVYTDVSSPNLVRVSVLIKTVTGTAVKFETVLVDGISDRRAAPENLVQISAPVTTGGGSGGTSTGDGGFGSGSWGS